MTFVRSFGNSSPVIEHFAKGSTDRGVEERGYRLMDAGAVVGGADDFRS